MIGPTMHETTPAPTGSDRGGERRDTIFPVRRREFLRAAGATTLAGLTGLAATGSAAATSSIVDTSVMTEVHVDVSEGEEVSGIVENVSEGELLVFPSGTFTWSERAFVTIDDWGIRCQPDTVFEVPAGLGDGGGGELLKTKYHSACDNYLLENLTFDSPGRAAPRVTLGARNAAHVKGLHYKMNGPTSDQQQSPGMWVAVENESGVFKIEDYRQLNNGDLGGYANGDSRVGCYIGPAHVGTARFVNPVLQGFPNNGFYVARQNGTVIIEDGLLMNNNVAQVRVSGGVEVYNTTLYFNIGRYLDGPGVLEADAHNTRGFWGDTKSGEFPHGGLIKNCDVIAEDVRHGTALALAGSDNEYITVEDTQFLNNDDDQWTYLAKADTNELRSNNCTFDGTTTQQLADGDVVGSDNNVYQELDPGTLPVASTSDYQFDWSDTHSETPGRVYDHTLRVVADDGADRVYYIVTTTGELVKGDSADSEESVVQTDDGSYTGIGAVDDGDVDSFQFYGSIEHWEAKSDEYSLYVDGTEVVVHSDGTQSD